MGFLFLPLPDRFFPHSDRVPGAGLSYRCRLRDLVPLVWCGLVSVACMVLCFGTGGPVWEYSGSVAFRFRGRAL